MDPIDRLFEALIKWNMGEPADPKLSPDEILHIATDPVARAVLRGKLNKRNDDQLATVLADYLRDIASALEREAGLSDEGVKAVDWIVRYGLRVVPLAGGGLMAIGLFASGAGMAAGAILIVGGLGALGLAGMARWSMARNRRKAADAAAHIREFADDL